MSERSKTYYYAQSSGQLRDADKVIGDGYSGAPGHVNNPASEAMRSKGPIPRGRYKLMPAVNHKKLGPCSIPLKPDGHNALGRSAFYIHGDNAKRNKSASSGCIILKWELRTRIAKDGAFLEVV